MGGDFRLSAIPLAEKALEMTSISVGNILRESGTEILVTLLGNGPCMIRGDSAFRNAYI